MGIKNLNKFLHKHCPEVFREVPLTKYKGKRIAIDINLYLFRYKSIYKEKWLTGFMNLILCLQRHEITCCFVYDTKAPAEKNNRKFERKQRKLKAEQRIYEIETSIEKFMQEGCIDSVLLGIMEKKGHKKLLSHSNPIYSI